MIALWIAADVATTSLLASTRRALRRLLPAGGWFWLVRPEAAEAWAAVALVLFHRLPGILVAAERGLGGHV